MNKNKGFSLVELIVVIAIMAVLVGIIAPQFLGYVEKAKKSVAITNCETVVKTAEVYMTDTGDTDLESPYTEIKEKSNAKGVINEIQNNSSSVTYLKYTEEYVVVYQNGIYTIEGEATAEEEEPQVATGYVMTDIDGEEHVLEAGYTGEEFEQLIGDSGSGTHVAQGTLIKEDDNYYVVGWNTYFGNNGTGNNISSYSNAISISGGKVYTDGDMIILPNGAGEKWPNRLPKGTVRYSGGKYYVAPGEISEGDMSLGAWIEIKE